MCYITLTNEIGLTNYQLYLIRCVFQLQLKNFCKMFSKFRWVLFTFLNNDFMQFECIIWTSYERLFFFSPVKVYFVIKSTLKHELVTLVLFIDSLANVSQRPKSIFIQEHIKKNL